MNAPAAIATLATVGAKEDLQLLLGTLALWNTPAPPVYLFCDSAVAAAVAAFKYPGPLYIREDLNRYSGLVRSTMEKTKGSRYPTLWMDFMTEKIRLLEWIFEEAEKEAKGFGVLFCDADICFTGPLPLFPLDAAVALSPHEIRGSDEAKYGRYNGGMLWIRDPVYLNIWSTACTRARFYEQSALEEVADAASAKDALLLFPKTQNYGWWRLFQGEAPFETLKAEWGLFRAEGTSGITVLGTPLGSVHTHFGETTDIATTLYNQFIIGHLRKLKTTHAPARRLLALLERLFRAVRQN